MTTRKKAQIGFLSISFGILWAIQSYAVATSVRQWLDDATMMRGGGLPYEVCFLLSGLTISAVAVSWWILQVTGWSRTAFLKAIRLAFGVSMTAAIVCTIWFVVLTGYFNPVGLLGLAVAITGGLWAMTLTSVEIGKEKHE